MEAGRPGEPAGAGASPKLVELKTSRNQSSTFRAPLRLCNGEAHCPVEGEQSSAASQASQLASAKPACSHSCLAAGLSARLEWRLPCFAAVLASNLGGVTGALLGADGGSLAGRLHLDVLYPVKGRKRCFDPQNGYGGYPDLLPASLSSLYNCFVSAWLVCAYQRSLTQQLPTQANVCSQHRPCSRT